MGQSDWVTAAALIKCRRVRRIAAAAALSCLVPGMARAVGEGERQLALEGGYLHGLSHDRGALYVGLLARQGVTDGLSLRLQGGVSADADHAAYWGGAGLTYAWDTLRWVPFVDAGVVVGGSSEVAIGGSAEVGVEYLLGPHWTVAAVARGWLLTRDSSALTALLRIGYVF
jgi:hypothetical protein